VSSHVDRQVASGAERSKADLTEVWFFPGVMSSVDRQMSGLREAFATRLTLVRTLSTAQQANKKSDQLIHQSINKNQSINGLVPWRSSDTCRINKVALHRAGLVHGWVTACGQVNHLGMYPAVYVNSAFHPSGVGKPSISLSGCG